MNFRFRSRSCRVIQDSSAVAAQSSATAAPAVEEDIAGSNHNCWSNMPVELLREVLMRIEASENIWPIRKNVVACGGVCRNWREIVKEIVATPEASGMLTFPISVKQPGPRESLVRCFIKRNRSMQTYHLYLSLTQALADDGKFLLAARKCRHTTCTDYIISINADDMSKGSNTYIGKLRSNFLGTKFVIYDGLPPHTGAKVSKSRSSRLVGSKQVSPRVSAGSYPVAHISYELNVLGSRYKTKNYFDISKAKIQDSASILAPWNWMLTSLIHSGPRRMQCIMDGIPGSAVEPGGVAPTQTEFPLSNVDSFPILPFFRSKSSRLEKTLSTSLAGQRDGPLILRNKSPRWHEQLQCWCLNFHGRVTVASVKNFQLVAAPPIGQPSRPEHEKVILQFGKVGKDMFTMDYKYPISAFQAFAICLSSFDTKIACE